jgi:ADP-dependent NAD(P)H-hydrate dehydratase
MSDVASVPTISVVAMLPPFPMRSDEAHKGDCGRVTIIAGSRGMSGAAALCATAALRGGAGLVTVAIPEGVGAIVGTIEPSYMTVALPEDDAGRIRGDAAAGLTHALANQSAAAIGPGLGQSVELKGLVSDLYANLAIPLVVDADGLNLLAQSSELFTLRDGTAPRVLTPHPGEFSRMTGLSTEAIQRDRARCAAEFARRHRVVVVLKGHETVITDGDRLAINTTGNSGMATGGTGDVLTGLVASLLAQGMTPFDAAHLAAHLHGLAGDLAAEAHSKPGLIASDLLRFIGRAWCELGL